MALRIRKLKNGNFIIICAANSLPKPGDGYIDDELHNILANELVVITCYGVTPDGVDLWRFVTTSNPSYPYTLEARLKQEKECKGRVWETSGNVSLEGLDK